MHQFKKYLEIIQENVNKKISIRNVSGGNIKYNNTVIPSRGEAVLDLDLTKPIFVGKDEMNDIIIPIDIVSRKHLSIQYVGKDELLKSEDFNEFIALYSKNKWAVGYNDWGLKITDLNSTNGTIINSNNRPIPKGGSKIIFKTLKDNQFVIGTFNKNFIIINF